MKWTLISLVLAGCLAGCSYLGTMATQAGYSLHQLAEPELRVYKHMLSRETFLVFGRIGAAEGADPAAMAVVAVADTFRPAEVVDVNHTSRPDSYYGLHLPAGDYRLLVVSDLDRDGFFDDTEVVGGRALSVTPEAAPDKVLGGIDIGLAEGRTSAGGPFRIAVQPVAGRAESLFYPKGSLRPLDDPLFSPQMAELGLYEPAAFLEQAPMLFYAIEEDAGFKVPVVFVHGIGGSVRDFAPMVAALDRSRFRPWFFYYPSGVDLHQSGAMFYRLFLSGEVIPLGEMPLVVVAHSMGGLVVREALNHTRGAAGENRVQRLITIASPLGGHPAARSGAQAPVVLPSWRDLDPDSDFIAALHRHPLPAGLDYHLLFAYGDDSTIRLGANSDGIVPLSSQLSPAAQREAAGQRGFDATHVGILKSPEAIAEVMRLVAAVRAPIPEAMLAAAERGGYPVELGAGYTPLQAFYVQQMGHLLEALAAGTLSPIDPVQEQFVRAARGESLPQSDAETTWVRFVRDCAQRRLLARCPGE